MQDDQQAEIEWRGAVPVSTQFDDPYFSLDDGLAETLHTFLDGNDLPARFAPGFHVAELGFGTGLNLLATWRAWLDHGTKGPLRFTSFEAFPLAQSDMAQALTAYPELQSLAQPLIKAWPKRQLRTETLDLTVIIGDARQTLPNWTGKADAWFLDGFAPAQNPELWDPLLLTQVAQHTKTNGTFATYTAAGAVRRTLADAGFDVTRRAGFGRKRHMSVGRLT